jgi:hypothetical protein
VLSALWWSVGWEPQGLGRGYKEPYLWHTGETFGGLPCYQSSSLTPRFSLATHVLSRIQLFTLHGRIWY